MGALLALAPSAGAASAEIAWADTPAVEPAAVTAKVIGGSIAADEELPWIAAVSDAGRIDPHCGGALVSPTMVVTAAHCVTTDGDHPLTRDPASLAVALGRENLATDDGDVHAVRAIGIHPDYDPAAQRFDVAVLHLAVAAARPTVAIADDASMFEPGPATVAGWGCVNPGTVGDCTLSNKLRVGAEDIQPAEWCASAGPVYAYYFDADTQLCGHDTSGKTRSCFGDSGGPLTVERSGLDHLVGVVSWGPSQCSVATPVVYTSLAAARPWLLAGATGSPLPDAPRHRPVAYARSMDTVCPTTVPAAELADVAPDHVHRRAIDCLLWRDVSKGFDPVTYRPDAAVTREQMATFMARLIAQAGKELPRERDCFVDDDASTHEANINALCALGLVAGVDAQRYAPGSPVTRAQAATFMRRTFEHITGQPLGPSGDYFADDDESAHEGAINAIAAAGYVVGTSAAERSFGPERSVTRAAMATLLARVMDHLATA